MATIMSILGPILSVFTSILGGGPLGAIVGGIGAIGLLIGGIILYGKFKAWQYASAQNSGNAQAVTDNSHVIDSGQHQSSDDEISEAQSIKDKLAAIEALKHKGG